MPYCFQQRKILCFISISLYGACIRKHWKRWQINLAVAYFFLGSDLEIIIIKSFPYILYRCFLFILFSDIQLQNILIYIIFGELIDLMSMGTDLPVSTYIHQFGSLDEINDFYRMQINSSESNQSILFSFNIPDKFHMFAPLISWAMSY